MDRYRSIVVNIHVGRRASYVAVVARDVHGGRRRDHLLYRGVVDLSDVDTVRAALRVAADTLTETADRL